MAAFGGLTWDHTLLTIYIEYLRNVRVALHPNTLTRWRVVSSKLALASFAAQ